MDFQSIWASMFFAALRETSKPLLVEICEGQRWGKQTHGAVAERQSHERWKRGAATPGAMLVHPLDP